MQEPFSSTPRRKDKAPQNLADQCKKDRERRINAIGIPMLKLGRCSGSLRIPCPIAAQSLCNISHDRHACPADLIAQPEVACKFAVRRDRIDLPRDFPRLLPYQNVFKPLDSCPCAA